MLFLPSQPYLANTYQMFISKFENYKVLCHKREV